MLVSFQFKIFRISKFLILIKVSPTKFIIVDYYTFSQNQEFMKRKTVYLIKLYSKI